MYKKISVALLLVFMGLTCKAASVSADVLVGAYTQTSSPAIANNYVIHSFRSGNLLYLSLGGNTGFQVVNTQGTETFADDVLVGGYTTTTTPALENNYPNHSFLDGNLLYISTLAGLTVINTQGTETLADDTLVGNYDSGTTPAVNVSYSAFRSGNMLYVSSASGLIVINTQGTETVADDTEVAAYNDASTPAIGNNFVYHTTLQGNGLYLSTDSGFYIIDTQGTQTQSDDALVGTYNSTSTPAINSDTVRHSFISGNYLYLSSNGGLTVINTLGTTAQSDDIVVGTYNTSSSPALSNDIVVHTMLSGNRLYVSTNTGGLSVIDTQGTETMTDDTLIITYGASSTPSIGTDFTYNSFLVGNLLYVGTATQGLAVIKLTPPPASDTITVNLPINATISITSPADVTMGAITGTGQSALTTNQAEWITKTNNAAGYELSIQASNASMQNANLDTVAGYTPATPSTPEPWSIASTDSEWGMHYSFPQSTLGNDTVWGAGDTYADNWVNVPTTPYVIETATAPTDNIGDSAVIIFGAEVGASKIQPTGSYSVDVTMTATTL